MKNPAQWPDGGLMEFTEFQFWKLVVLTGLAFIWGLIFANRQ